MLVLEQRRPCRAAKSVLLFLSSSGRRAITQSRRTCCAEGRVFKKVVGSEKVPHTARTQVKSSPVEGDIRVRELAGTDKGRRGSWVIYYVTKIEVFTLASDELTATTKEVT